MRKDISFLFNIILIAFILIPLGILLVNNFDYKFEGVINGFIVILVVSGLMSLLVLNLKLTGINWKGEKYLQDEIKKTTERYEENERFIAAMKKVIVRKTITVKEIEEQLEKDKTNGNN